MVRAAILASGDGGRLQAILDARGYTTETDGVIGEATDQAIRRFQREHDLDPDGVVGPLTWRKILSMED